MNLDDRLNSAVSELRDHLDHDSIPAFEPGRQVPLAGAALAVVAALMVGAGLVAYLTNGGNADPVSEVVVAAPEPGDSSDRPPETGRAEAPATDGSALGTDTTGIPPTDLAGSTAEPEPNASARTFPVPTQLTDADTGEFIAPIPGVSAWSTDDELLLLYRTGDAPAGHVIVAVSSGQIMAEPIIDAPDIEQVYWHPLVNDQLLWLRGESLVSLDVRTGVEAVVAEFAGCTAVDTGRFPSPPSASGAFHVLCTGARGVSLIRVDLALGTTADMGLIDQPGEVDALTPSPSGALIALSRIDGSIEIIDLQAGSSRTIDLSGPSFVWTVLPDGTETLALASYDAALPGTLILAPADLTQPGPRDVVIGPDAGDEYPPSGTQLAATTGGDASVVVATVRGPATADSLLTGRLVIASIAMDAAGDPIASITTLEHEGAAVNDYWSTNSISINAAGTRVVWASDLGGPETNTFIVDVSAATAVAE